MVGMTYFGGFGLLLFLLGRGCGSGLLGSFDHFVFVLLVCFVVVYDGNTAFLELIDLLIVRNLML